MTLGTRMRSCGRCPAPFRCAVAALLLTVTGCVAIDGAELSDLHPIPGGFEYRAATTLFYGPTADGWAEAQRLDFLAAFVRQSGICPHGYQLNSRQVAYYFQSPLGYPV